MRQSVTPKKWAHRIGLFVDRISIALAAILLLNVVAIIMAGVIARNFFNNGLTVLDGIAAWSLMWVVAVGAAALSLRGSHLEMDFVFNRLPERAQRAIAFIQEIAGIALSACLILWGIETVEALVDVGQMSANGRYPAWIGTASIIVGFMLVIVAHLCRLITGDIHKETDLSSEI